MASTMEQEVQLRLLRRAQAALTRAAGTDERDGDHLHFDRAAHAWRTHEELGRVRAEARTGREPAVAVCS
jgi:hypothetical protein